MPVVFTSATLSLAALARSVHTDSDLEPTDLVAIPVEFNDDIEIESVEVETLPADWRTFPPPPALARIGEQWLHGSRTAVLSVPSVVIPHERNLVLNPTHREFARLSIGRSEPFSFDPGMWKK
jgi:RES domain-containing protein